MTDVSTAYAAVIPPTRLDEIWDESFCPFHVAGVIFAEL
jgi:hypothetical protein